MAVPAAADDSTPIKDILSYPILFADRVIKSAHDAESFKPENDDLARHVTDLSHLLRSAARLTTTSAVYDRPLRCVSVNVTKTLDRALALARKCRFKRTNLLHQLFSITVAADFKKLSNLLESSVADVKWILSILEQNNYDDDECSDDFGAVSVSLPPFASTDPILAFVWPAIAAVHGGRSHGARELATLAFDDDRNRKIIADEHGIPPLLKMLKDGTTAEAQSASAEALCNLACRPDCVKAITEASGVPIIVKALSQVAMPAQLTLVNLISKMLDFVHSDPHEEFGKENDYDAHEEFGKENVAWPLVGLLGMDVLLEAELTSADLPVPVPAHSFSSFVETNEEIMKKKKECAIGSNWDYMDRTMLKVSSAAALCKLARGSLSNSRKITETRALLVLAKIIETETGDLRTNCLMLVMELAAVAERNSILKRVAFKLSSPSAKAIFNQLLRVINHETNPQAAILAIKAIGCLSSMFSTKEKWIVESLVMQVSRNNITVASEAAMALCKFVHDKNYNCKEHSQAIIDHDGVRKIMSLIRRKDHLGKLHELVLLCNLVSNVGNSKELGQVRGLSLLLEDAARVAQYPTLRELFTKAIHQLSIYQESETDVHGQV